MKRPMVSALGPVLCCLSFLSFMASVHAEETDKDLPMQMVNFRMTDASGKTHELFTHADKKAVVLFSQLNGCPIVRQSFPYLEEIKAKYGPKGVEFLYFNSNEYDDDEAIVAEAKDYSVTVPIMHDRGATLSHVLQSERSGEIFVVDPKTWKITYRGMADDRFDYGLQRSLVEKFWLIDSLDALLAGEKARVRKTIAKGCLLPLELPDEARYVDQVVPVLDARLPNCGGAASWGDVPEMEARKKKAVFIDAMLTQRVPKDAACGEAGKEAPFTVGELLVLLKWLGFSGGPVAE